MVRLFVAILCSTEWFAEQKLSSLYSPGIHWLFTSLRTLEAGLLSTAREDVRPTVAGGVIFHTGAERATGQSHRE